MLDQGQLAKSGANGKSTIRGRGELSELSPRQLQLKHHLQPPPPRSQPQPQEPQEQQQREQHGSSLHSSSIAAGNRAEGAESPPPNDVPRVAAAVLQRAWRRVMRSQLSAAKKRVRVRRMSRGRLGFATDRSEFGEVSASGNYATIAHTSSAAAATSGERARARQAAFSSSLIASLDTVANLSPMLLDMQMSHVQAGRGGGVGAGARPGAGSGRFAIPASLTLEPASPLSFPPLSPRSGAGVATDRRQTSSPTTGVDGPSLWTDRRNTSSPPLFTSTRAVRAAAGACAQAALGNGGGGGRSAAREGPPRDAFGLNSSVEEEMAAVAAEEAAGGASLDVEGYALDGSPNACSPSSLPAYRAVARPPPDFGGGGGGSPSMSPRSLQRTNYSPLTAAGSRRLAPVSVPRKNGAEKQGQRGLSSFDKEDIHRVAEPIGLSGATDCQEQAAP